MQTIFDLLMLSVTELLYLLGILIVVGFALGALENISSRWLYQAFGKKGILLTACIGTPVHEAGHALMCLVFKHKILEIKFLDLQAKDQTLGYVRHAFNKSSLYQCAGTFFISMGPIFSGTLAILFFMYFLQPGLFQTLQNAVAFIPSGTTLGDLGHWSVYFVTFLYKAIWAGSFLSAQFWLFLFLSMCVASHIALSPADIKGAAYGLAVIFCVVIIGNFIAYFLDIETLPYVLELARFNIYMLSVLSIAVGFSVLTAVLAGIASMVRRSI